MWQGLETPRFTRWRGEVLSIGVIVLASVALLFPALFLGRALLPLDLLPVMGPFRAHPEMFLDWPGRPMNPLLDPLQQYWPWRKFACERLLSGEIPLWNPHSFSGYPFLANLQSALLYPPNLLFLPFAAGGSVERGFAWSALFHLVAGGILALFLLRRWGLSSPAASLGAVAFTFSGWRMAWLEYPTVSLWVVTWLPACMLATSELAEKGRWWPWTPLLSLSVSLTLLGGHLQMAAYVLFVAVSYALFEAIRGRRPLLLVQFALGLLGGVVLSLPQLLPTLELLGLSPRAGLAPLREVLETAVPLTEVGRLVSPDLSGNPADYNYVGPFNYLETCGYVGGPTLLFAALAIRRRMGALAVFLLSLDIYLLLCAFGAPVYALLWPILRGATAPGRLFAVHALVVGALASLGLERVRRGEGEVKWHLLLATSLSALAVGHTLGSRLEALSQPEFARYVGGRLVVTALLWALGCGVVGLIKAGGALKRFSLWLPSIIVAADLVALGARFNPMPPLSYAEAKPDCAKFVKPEGGVKPRLISVGTNFLDWFAPNLPMAFGLFDVNGSDSLVPEGYARLLEALWGERKPWLLREFRARLLDALNVRYVLSAVPLASEGLEFVALSDMWVYKRGRALPRAYIARRVWTFYDKGALRNWLLSPGRLEREAGLVGPATVGQGEGEAHISGYEPNFVEVRYHAPRGGLLVLCDAHYPGWRAFVQGREKPIL
ncbi:MAG TPA: hypothetical protein EYP65_06015, partial [Armatimonadetes bacterium]|nr:hypothetical protein [Armatimonadota bacterium]